MVRLIMTMIESDLKLALELTPDRPLRPSIVSKASKMSDRLRLGQSLPHGCEQWNGWSSSKMEVTITFHTECQYASKLVINADNHRLRLGMKAPMWGEEGSNRIFSFQTLQKFSLNVQHFWSRNSWIWWPKMMSKPFPGPIHLIYHMNS